MIHPNDIAVNYIWEKVKQNWISESSYGMMKEIESIQKGLKHKPLVPESIDFADFRTDLLKRANALQAKFEHVKFV